MVRCDVVVCVLFARTLRCSGESCEQSFVVRIKVAYEQPGTLVALADYLHQRTGGMIGSLSHLIRGAAIDAIVTGEEKITRTGLDGVHLDHTAEHHHAATTPRTTRARRRPRGPR